jgi:hypothetical protein
MQLLVKVWPWLYYTIYEAIRTDILEQVSYREKQIIVMLEKGKSLYGLIQDDDTESIEFQGAWLAFEDALEKLMEGE